MRILGSRLCVIVAGVTLIASAAFAQATSPAPNETAPGANPTAPAQSLSKELNQSNGIIHPKEVDPGIQKPAPKTGDPNVVPPPGTSGGAPAPSQNKRRVLRLARRGGGPINSPLPASEVPRLCSSAALGRLRTNFAPDYCAA